jgi:hypothetical protein
MHSAGFTCNLYQNRINFISQIQTILKIYKAINKSLVSLII